MLCLQYVCSDEVWLGQNFNMYNPLKLLCLWVESLDSPYIVGEKTQTTANFGHPIGELSKGGQLGRLNIFLLAQSSYNYI